MYSLEEFVIAVYCLVDQFYGPFAQRYRLRKRGKAPLFSDTETLTLLIVGRVSWSFYRQRNSCFFSTWQLARLVSSPWLPHDVSSSRGKSLAGDAVFSARFGLPTWRV